jgi:hypothetical protein
VAVGNTISGIVAVGNGARVRTIRGVLVGVGVIWPVIAGPQANIGSKMIKKIPCLTSQERCINFFLFNSID